MNLALIETFLQIVEKKSLAAAAKTLGLTLAAVSKQLTKLESSLGVTIIVRTTRSLELTDIGREYYEQCKNIMDEVYEANTLISKAKMEPSGPLKVVSGRFFGKKYIIPYLQEFLDRYPKITLSLELTERVVNFDSEKVDVLIGMSLSAPLNAIQKEIGRTRYVLAASPGYLKRFGKLKAPADLLKHRYLAHSGRVPDDEILFKNHETLHLTPYLRINDTESMVLFAKEGLGIVKLHSCMVNEDLENGTLIEILPGFLKEEVPIFVAYAQRRHIRSALRAFIDFTICKI